MSAAVSAAVAGGSLIAAGGSMWAAKEQGDAAKAAADANIKALKKAPTINPAQIAKQAENQDILRFQKTFEVQDKYDPVSGELRRTGARNMLDELNAGTPYADNALKELQANADLEKGQYGSVIESLIARAKEELAAGATLPAEFQAELVKSGLENSAASGYALNPTGATGANLRTLLGTAGLNLKAQRLGQAGGALSLAGDLQNRRAAILAQISGLDTALRDRSFAQAATANEIGNNNAPVIGLSGADLANLNVAKVNAGAQTAAQIGQLQGSKALASGATRAAMIQGGTGALSGLLQAMPGMLPKTGTAPVAGATGATGVPAGAAAMNTSTTAFNSGPFSTLMAGGVPSMNNWASAGVNYSSSPLMVGRLSYPGAR